MNKKIPSIIAIGIIVFLVLVVISIITDKSEEIPIPQDDLKIESIPKTTKILFTSNKDTGGRRTEIYAMDENGENIKRITYSNMNHFIQGMDKSGRYLVTSRSDRDTEKPKGIGEEDERSLWVIDMETKDEKKLTKKGNHAEGDSFSPDGEWIVFLMDVGGRGLLDIYKIKRDGTELTQLTNTLKKSEADPAWSNDGKRIVFTEIDSLSENPRFILKTMDTNGDNVEAIFDNNNFPIITVPGAWPSGNYDPAWSPDDQWIVFERGFEYNKKDPQNFGSGNWHILKVKSDGSGEVVDFSELGGHTNKAEYLPSFSPDGKYVVYGAIHKAEKLSVSYVSIFIMDANTGQVIKRLTDNKFEAKAPVWIPK